MSLVKMKSFWHHLPSSVLCALLLITTIRADVINLSEELEEDGYFRKEHSLTKPYTGTALTQVIISKVTA